LLWVVKAIPRPLYSREGDLLSVPQEGYRPGGGGGNMDRCGKSRRNFLCIDLSDFFS
jgi:hypothetical protein